MPPGRPPTPEERDPSKPACSASPSLDASAEPRGHLAFRCGDHGCARCRPEPSFSERSSIACGSACVPTGASVPFDRTAERRLSGLLERHTSARTAAADLIRSRTSNGRRSPRRGLKTRGSERLATTALTPDPSFVIRSQDDGRRGAQEDDCISRDSRAHTAPIQAKDPEGAENEGDPMQSDAQQANQAHVVHHSQTPQSGDRSRSR
jgi:hypothetical protein